jgi:hypothetical protein
LYGIDSLIEAKEEDKRATTNPPVLRTTPPFPFILQDKPKEDTSEITEDVIRLREEISEQIKALNQIKEMAAMYGFDISRPAKNSTEAVQRTYFAFLAAIKEQD